MIAELSRGIDLLANRPARNMGRRSKDFMLDFLNMRAWSYLWLGKTDFAIKDAKTVLALNPTEPDANMVLGLASSDSETKKAAFRSCLEMCPNYFWCVIGLANEFASSSPKKSLSLLQKHEVYFKVEAETWIAIIRAIWDQQFELKAYADAALTADKGLRLKPWDLDLQMRRLAIDRKLEKQTFDEHFWEGMRAFTSHVETTKSAGASIIAFIVLIHNFTSLSEQAPPKMSKQVADFSTWLAMQIGWEEVAMWWQYYSLRPDATDIERALAQSEVVRIRKLNETDLSK